MTVRAGFIGLGDIGLPMAERIATGGVPLTVWNRTASKAAPLEQKGAAVAASPRALAEAVDVVCLCLDGPKAIEAVVFGLDGIAAATTKPRLVVDHSTTHPHLTVEFAARLKAEAGIAWLDAPVSGGPVGARAGTLATFAGGDADDLELARPILACFAGQITHMGGLGAGQATKATNQIINFATVATLAEAFVFARRQGLDVARLPEALAGGFADSNILREFGRAKQTGERGGLTSLIDGFAAILEGRIDPRFAGRLTILLKDLDIIGEAARRGGSPAALTGVVDGFARMLNYQEPAGSSGQ